MGLYNKKLFYKTSINGCVYGSNVTNCFHILLLPETSVAVMTYTSTAGNGMQISNASKKDLWATANQVS